MGAACNNSSPQCPPGCLWCVLLRRHWAPGMASHPSTFMTIGSLSGWGVLSGDSNFAYSQVAALLLTEGQQSPSLSTCHSLSMTLVWRLVYTMLTEECSLCDKKKEMTINDMEVSALLSGLGLSDLGRKCSLVHEFSKDSLSPCPVQGLP